MTTGRASVKTIQEKETKGTKSAPHPPTPNENDGRVGLKRWGFELTRERRLGF